MSKCDVTDLQAFNTASVCITFRIYASVNGYGTVVTHCLNNPEIPGLIPAHVRTLRD